MKNLAIIILVLMPFVLNAQTKKPSEVQLILENVDEIPDWEKVYDGLTGKYRATEVDSILQVAKVEFYWKKKQYHPYIKEYVQFVQKYNQLVTPSDKNKASWRVFEYGADAKDLELAMTWMKVAHYEEPMNPYFIDTQANLYYKIGNYKRAISWQTRAAWLSQFDPGFVTTLYKMRAGIPTWKYPESQPSTSDQGFTENVWQSIQVELKRQLDSLVWNARLISARANNEYASVIVQYAKEFKTRDMQLLNEAAWTIFKTSNKGNELKQALLWSNESLKAEAKNYAYMDTYANLLYKLGNRKEAIVWSEKALALCPQHEKQAFESTLVKIKKGEKTWPD